MYDVGCQTMEFLRKQAYNWFLEYIDLKEDEEFTGDSRRRSILQFWCGWSFVPFGDLSKRLKVHFLADDEKNSLPNGISVLCNSVATNRS